MNGVAHDIDDPEKNISVWKRLQSARDRRGFQQAGNPQPRAICASARSAPDPTTPRFSITSGSPVSESRLRRRRRRRHLPLHLRRFLLVHALRRPGLRVWPRAGPDRRHRGHAPGRRRPAAVRFRRFHRYHPQLLSRKLQKLARDRREQIVERNRQIDEGVFTATADPQENLCAPEERAGAPVPEFRSPGKRARGAYAHRRALREGAHGCRRKRWLGARPSLAARSERQAGSRPSGCSRCRTDFPAAPGSSTRSMLPASTPATGSRPFRQCARAIEQNQWKDADEQIVRVGKVLENVGETIDSAAAALDQVTK